MPVVRYFFFVGGALLALLFILDAALPKPPAADGPDTEVDLTTVRIHSDQKWPERVVFDTSASAAVPATVPASPAREPRPMSRRRRLWPTFRRARAYGTYLRNLCRPIQKSRNQSRSRNVKRRKAGSALRWFGSRSSRDLASWRMIPGSWRARSIEPRLRKPRSCPNVRDGALSGHRAGIAECPLLTLSGHSAMSPLDFSRRDDLDRRTRR